MVSPRPLSQVLRDSTHAVTVDCVFLSNGHLYRPHRFYNHIRIVIIRNPGPAHYSICAFRWHSCRVLTDHRMCHVPMLEETAGHDLSFVKLLGGHQYLSSALPYELRHAAEFSGGGVYSYTIGVATSHFHSRPLHSPTLCCVILPAQCLKPACFTKVGQR